MCVCVCVWVCVVTLQTFCNVVLCFLLLLRTRVDLIWSCFYCVCLAFRNMQPPKYLWISLFWFFEFLCFFVLHFILFFYFICIYFYILLTFASLTPFTGSLQTCLNYLFTRAASHSFALLIFSPYFCLHSALLLCCCLFFFLMIFASFLRLYKNILIKIHFWAFAYERELRCFNCSAVVVTVVVVMFLFCCACGKNCCDLLIWAHCWLQMSVVVTHTLLFLCFYFAFAKLDFCLLFLNIIFWVFFWSECDTGEYSFTAFCVYFYKSVQSFDAKKCSTQNGAKKRKIYIQIYKIYILF